MRAEIKDNFLYINGKRVDYKPSPNISSGTNSMKYIIEHYTATFGSESPISWLTNRESNVSAHLVIDKKGHVTQLAPFNKVTWHAGKSSWKGIEGLNSHSIGIEIVNSGILAKRADKFYSSDGYQVKNYIELTNKLGLKATWELYPEEQTDVVAEVTKALVSHYKVLDVLGHEDVSPGRKTDPGPAFPWEKIRQSTGFKDVKFTLVDLNLRTTPSGTIIRVLPKNSPVIVMEEKNGWTNVGEGWVSSKFLK